MPRQYYILQTASIKEALNKISDNQQGFILTTNKSDEIVGLVTDGDIRAKLVEGISLDQPIASCANSNFIWADTNTPREIILKQLDHNIRFIPLLDKNRRLIDIVTRYHLPIPDEERVYARAKSPVRISFGGGGSDLTHYFMEENGAVINTTISLYSHATLIKRRDDQINIYSRDLDETYHAENLIEALSSSNSFKLIFSVIKLIHPEYGFDMYLHSDFPIKSGLGGSAVVASSILGCFNQFRTDKWDQYEMAELAYQSERLYLDIAGGWQDQYATVFGGFNFMEFRLKQNIIHPLRIDSEIILELEESLVLCDTGTTHESGDVHLDQKSEMSSKAVRQMVKENVKLTYEIRNQLLRGRLADFGKSLDKAWSLKKQFSSHISNSGLDDIYNVAKSNGATGGKLLGAGGGGFFLFFVPATHKHILMKSLEQIGKTVRPFRFEEKGLQGWTVRERQNNI